MIRPAQHLSPSSARPSPSPRRSQALSARPHTPDGFGPGSASAGRAFDTAVEALLYPMFAFAPLAFGAVQAWSREVVLVLIATATVVVAAKHVVLAWTGHRSGYRWSWAYPPMLLFLAVCAAQVAPLPTGWVGAVSPSTVRVKADLLSDLPDVADRLRHTTISFYPHATSGQAVLVAAVAALFAVVLDVFRDPARIRRLLSVVAGVGLVVAGMAGYQNLTGTTTVYGLALVSHRNAGPFLNYSHFSQFMNLSVGAALALLLDRLAELAEFYRTPREVWSAVRQPRNAAVWAWATLCVIGPLTVLLSLSRMGMISLALAAVASGSMLAWRARSTAGGHGRDWVWVLVGLAGLVFAALLYVGSDMVSARLHSLADARSSGRRSQMLRDMVPEFRQFPLLGTGLGTHEFVFGMYDHRDLPNLATHAENEYAQVLEETGAVGLALAAAFLAVVGVNYIRATRQPLDPIDYVPFGLGFGLVAILVHSATDFGQHIPANAVLTATFTALLAGRAKRGDNADTEAKAAAGLATAAPHPGGRRLGPVVGASSLAVVAVAAAVRVAVLSERARAAESAWSVAQDRADDLATKGWQGSVQAYVDLLTPATAALAREPDDVAYRYWTDAYRWHALAHDADPVTGSPTLPVEALPLARQLVTDLDDVRALCPSFGPPLCVAGQINRFVLGQTELGDRQIRESYRLSPFDRSVCLIAGLDAVAGHRWDDAADVFQHYVRLGGDVRDFADPCLHAGHPQIPYHLLQHDHVGLAYLASRMPAGDPAWSVWINRCRSEAAAQLAVDAQQPDASPTVLAEQAAVEQGRGRPAAAVPLYRRALQVSYADVGMRVRLAACLDQAGRPAEAVQELRVVLRLRPDQSDAAARLPEYEARAAQLAPQPHR